MKFKDLKVNELIFGVDSSRVIESYFLLALEKYEDYCVALLLTTTSRRILYGKEIIKKEYFELKDRIFKSMVPGGYELMIKTLFSIDRKFEVRK